ncbi:MAG: hypothetical protein R3335_10510 [Anaerolineales bacterium]|nr:hypothetical protein [Anaerolineales bacterium]
MAKTFYTDRDIEDLAGRGISTLEVNEDVYVTDLAREKAERLGVTLVREHDTPPSAPIRPYVAAESAVATSSKPAASASSTHDEMFEQVRAAVMKRVGENVDTDLLDTIIRRVLANV